MLGGIDKPICCCHFEGGESLFSPSLSLPLSLSPSLSLSLPLSFFFFSSLFLLPFSSLSLSLSTFSNFYLFLFFNRGGGRAGGLPSSQSEQAALGSGRGKVGTEEAGLGRVRYA
jgi:hypothetical protein